MLLWDAIHTPPHHYHSEEFLGVVKGIAKMQFFPKVLQKANKLLCFNHASML
jgi:hypothetical protein